MPPRPAPDLDHRRDRIAQAAREIAAAEGWPAVTMRRVATGLGVTQPVIYSAFPDGRQAVLDAVALAGFADLAAALEASDGEPLARMRAYLDFATAHPSVYEAMFMLPSGLPFASDGAPEQLRRAFGALAVAFGGDDETRAEVAWATLHGLATLQIGGRLPADRADTRVLLAHEALSR